MQAHARMVHARQLVCLTLLFSMLGFLTPSHVAAESWYEFPRVVPADNFGGDRFGWSVAISGHTAFVGSIWDDDRGSASGSVYVYELSGPNWVQVQKIVPASIGAGDQFGISVAIRGDRAIVGAYEDDGMYPSYGWGQAFIYERVGGTWVEAAHLQPADMESGDGFGRTVDIEGDEAVVGAPNANSGTGEIHVYWRETTGWERIATLDADAVAGDSFGRDVSITFCAPCLGSNTPSQYIIGVASLGAVYVYGAGTMVPGWSYEVLTGSDTVPGDGFPSSISINGSWDHYLLVGAGSSGSSGAAYVFRDSGDGWAEQWKLTASDGAPGDGFGSGVSIMGDNGSWVAAVGSPDDEGGVGSAYVFGGNESGWAERAKLLREPATHSFDRMGRLIAIDESDGDVVLLGSPYMHASGNYSGAAFFYMSGCPDPVQPTLTAPSGPCATAPATLTWSPVDGATEYEVQLGTACGVGATYSTTNTEYTVSGLDWEPVYEWRVRARSECGTYGPWSDCTWFRIAPPVPEPTYLASPPDGTTGIDPAYLLLEWGTLTPATGWEFQMGTACGDGAISATSSPEAAFFPGLPLNQTYFWRARSQNECGEWGAWSDCYSFTTMNTPTGTDVTVEPEPGITLGFDEIVGSGDTTVDTSAENPGPDVNSYMFLGTFYDINTTADYTGEVEVCLEYDDTGMKLEQELDLKLFHLVNGFWLNITVSVNADTNIICGRTSTLSPFGLALFMPWMPDGTTPALAMTDDTVGVSWGDYDGDGDPDLYVVNHMQPDKMFRNDGAGVFTDVTTAPLGHSGQGSVGCWADYDNDGDKDLYLTVRGGANVLYENDNGKFIDATVAPLDDAGESHGAAWFDYDLDGDLDVYVSNYYEANRMYRNDGAGVFTDVSAAPINNTGQTTGASIADYDEDGDPDIYITNTGTQPNRLFRNDGGGSWTDVTPGSLAITTDSRGAAWGDYDNDGDLDLYVANGGGANKLFRNDGSNVFVDVSSGVLADAGSARGVGWQDYDNDGDLDLYIANLNSANKLIRNEGWGIFTDGTITPLDDAGYGIGVAWADYDGDGDSDLYLGNASGPNVLFRNDQVSSNHWLHVRLFGVTSNRGGIGARVRVVTGALDQIREVQCGSGYVSEASLTAEFGLGLNPTVDLVEVHWPSGAVTSISSGIGIDRVITVAEGATGTPDLPGETRLHAPRPNPFNPRTTVSFDIAVAGPVTMRVYDSKGRLVRTLLDGVPYDPGTYNEIWNGKDTNGNSVASGVYHVRFEAPGKVETRSVTLIR